MLLKEILAKDPPGLIARAYRFAEHAHAGQKRKSGEPYFRHVQATAEILHGWGMDQVTVAAGLLHDTAEDTPITIEELKKEFGEEVAFLVSGVTKLGHIKYRGATAKVENLRKLILALSEDLRVVFVKLADRMHNMRTLSALPPQKQKRIALETDEIYAPLANRLGMWQAAGELHDLAFPFLHPEEHRWLLAHVPDAYEERTAYLERIKPQVERLLAEQNMTPLAISFRAKRYSSLYKKLLRYGMDLNKIHDLVALRILVATTADCYATLGAIHAAWPPLPGRIKDFIAMPKPNGYRSLHTTVIGPEKRIVEIQIRTQEMNEADEFGVAAHWLYKQHGDPGASHPAQIRKAAEELAWVEQLRAWQEQIATPEAEAEEVLSAMKIDFFKDRIFAITPRGDVIDLPAGATPLDFAYRIHSQVGDSASGARVNGQIVPLNHELRSGDLVEILIQKGKHPSEAWLDIAKTAIAREHIRAALRHRKTGGLIPRSLRTEFRIAAKDRVGLLKDITAAIARAHVNITSVNQQESASHSHVIIRIVCDLGDREKIEKLVLKIRQITGATEVGFKTRS
ncbi:MAG: RelA/SpoT family protein [Candidatus Liptonbacteria bacterium]|nr:RelA/SpoT family protein [Candidatus Liptonbacteria bacterium]